MLVNNACSRPQVAGFLEEIQFETVDLDAASGLT
jgi:hypothetical protein